MIKREQPNEFATGRAKHGSLHSFADAGPKAGELTPGAARYLLSIKLPAKDEDRVNELSAKVRAGSLTEGEAQELDGYLLARAHCNRHKRPNLAGFDAVTGQIVRLFNPRMDIWGEHFAIVGAHLYGKTAIGRVTVDVLRMNGEDQIFVWNALLRES
jgi:hypothetical protein